MVPDWARERKGRGFVTDHNQPPSRYSRSPTAISKKSYEAGFEPVANGKQKKPVDETKVDVKLSTIPLMLKLHL